MIRVSVPALVGNKRKCLLTAFLVLAALSFDPRTFLGGDNATYILLARSVAGGHGYRDIWIPECSAEKTYPPGFPLLLVPFVSAFRNPVVPIKILILVLMAAGILLASLLCRKRGTELLALLVASPAVLEYSHLELSDTPYLCASLLALWILDGDKVSWKRWRFWLGIAAIAASYHIRTAGIALAIALPLFLLIRKRMADFVWASASLALLMLPWMLYSKSGGYGRGFMLVNDYDPSMGFVSAGDMLVRIATNLKAYLFGTLPGWMFPPMSGPLSVIAGVAVAVTCLYGLRRCELRLFHVYLACYLAMALVLPTDWSGGRYFLPVLPLVAMLFIRGLFTFLQKISRKRSEAVGIAVIALMAVALAVGDIPGIAEQTKCTTAFLRGDRLAGYPAEWSNLFRAADWARDSTPENAVFVCRKPTLFALESGRRSIPYPFTDNRDSVLGAISGAGYVVIDQVSGTTARYLVPALMTKRERYSVRHMSGGTFVLKAEN